MKNEVGQEKQNSWEEYSQLMQKALESNERIQGELAECQKERNSLLDSKISNSHIIAEYEQIITQVNKKVEVL